MADSVEAMKMKLLKKFTHMYRTRKQIQVFKSMSTTSLVSPKHLVLIYVSEVEVMLLLKY